MAEEAERAKKNAEKDANESEKRAQLLPGFQAELLVKDAGGILALSGSRMREYIRYFFQQRVVNLSKTKKVELQEILAPLLQQHYDAVAALDARDAGGSMPELPAPNQEEEV